MNTRTNIFLSGFLWCTLLAWTGVGMHARAQTPNPQPDVQSLMQAGKFPEASKEIARQLKRPDPDPQLQLLQCVVQAQQNQTDKAIVCLTSLVKQRPEMLEAYNNLGVLHASKGQHEEAQRWFTLGLQRQPSLWTLHQNLQNLQADLSRKAYARALQTELPLKETPPKLTILATTSLRNPLVLPPTKPADTASNQARLPSPAQLPRSDSSTAAERSSGAADNGSGPTPKSNSNELDEATRLQLQEAVQAWAQAWSSQNMKAYFAAYTPDYTPGKSISRTAWEAERTNRIADRAFVRVKVSHFSFENTGTKVIARFNQLYVSGNLQSTHRKRLELVQQAGQWKIARETVISN